MKILLTALGLAVLATSNAAWAGCTYPKAPDKIPDGTTASKAEMIAARDLFTAYNQQIVDYTKCLQTEHDDQVAKIDPKLDQAKKDAQKAELDKVLGQKNDAAVDEAQAVTGRFNAQIHAYVEKHKS